MMYEVRCCKSVIYKNWIVLNIEASPFICQFNP